MTGKEQENEGNFGEREKILKLHWTGGYHVNTIAKTHRNCTLEIHAFYCICIVPQVKHHVRRRLESLRPHTDSSLQRLSRPQLEVRMGNRLRTTLWARLGSQVFLLVRARAQRWHSEGAIRISSSAILQFCWRLGCKR